MSNNDRGKSILFNTLLSLYDDEHSFLEFLLDELSSRNLITSGVLVSRQGQEISTTGPSSETGEPKQKRRRLQTPSLKPEESSTDFIKMVVFNMNNIVESIKYINAHTASLSVLSTMRDYTFNEVVRRNWSLGTHDSTNDVKKKIGHCVHLMHFWYEMNTFEGIFIHKSSLTVNLDRLSDLMKELSIPPIPREVLTRKQRTGGRLMKLKRVFGWTLFLFDHVTPVLGHRMSLKAMDELEAYAETNPSGLEQIKLCFDKCISPKEVENMITQIVAELSGDQIFAQVVISDINKISQQL